ncbi:unnamed protein product, partial [Rotaria sp. Silwood1]
MFAIVPSIIFSIKGEATRIIIVDQSGRIGARLKENLSPEKISAKVEQTAQEKIKDLNASQEDKIKQNAKHAGESFIFVQYETENKPIEQIRQELISKIAGEEIDAYLIIPKDSENPDSKFEFFSRKAGDFVANSVLEDGLNEAVRSKRLEDANISEAKLKELSKSIKLDTKSIDKKGDEKDSTGILVASFIIGLMIYITLAIYGQAIMSAVVEEKETRIAEILFSSARPFELMMGKLVGVGLAALTQLGIWIISASVLA